VAHSLGEVVGLGLRNLAHCPVELNLMPESTVNWVQFNQKKPYFLASVFSLVLVVFAAGFVFQKLGDLFESQKEKLNTPLTQAQNRDSQFNRALSDLANASNNAVQLASWVENRYYWADVMSELHSVLIQVEANKQTDLGQPVGLWIEKFIVDPNHVEATAPLPPPPPDPGPTPPPADTGPAPVVAPPSMTSDPAYQKLDERTKQYYVAHPEEWHPSPAAKPAQPTPAPQPVTPAPVPVAPRTPKKVAVAGAKTGGIDSASILCRAVNLSALTGNTSVNKDIINDFVTALQNDPLFDGSIQAPTTFDTNANGTFTFELTLRLKKPLKL